MEDMLDLFDAIQGDLWIAIGNILAVSFLVPLIVFVVLYLARSPWWKTDLGVALLTQKFGFIAIFILIDIGIFWHDWPGRAAVRIVLYVIVALSLWLDFINLLRYQRMGTFNSSISKRPSLWKIIKAQFTGEEL